MINNFTVYYLNNNEWTDITSFCDLPFTNKDALDETLDKASLVMSFIEKEEPFRPFTKFKIVIYDSVNETTETVYKVVDRDIVEQNTAEYYTHQVYLIEPTKILEREITGGKSFTNRLRETIVPIYTQTVGIGTPFKSAYGEIILQGYNQPFIVDSNVLIHEPRTLTGITKNNGILGYEYWTVTSITIQVDKPDATTVTVTGGSEFLIDLLSSDYTDAQYTIRYILNYSYRNVPLIGSPSITSGTEQWEYSAISSNLEDVQQNRLTIGSVLRRYIKSIKPFYADTNNEGDQKYFLSDYYFNKYNKVLAPELLIANRTTFFEGLLQILQNVQGIPRLTANPANDKLFNYIIVDELDKNEVFTKSLDYNLKTNDYSSDLYATKLDMTVENILGTNDTENGAVIEPFRGGYKTTRAEDARIVISNDSAIITVDRPIYKIVKVEMGFINSTDEMGDITQFIYEETEYNKLTGVDKLFPNSKAYALYYSIGDTKIQGLQFKNEPSAGDIIGLVDPAMDNIIKTVYPSSSITPYKNLGFRITYIPLDTMRVEALHPNYLSFTADGTGSTLIENQSENIIDSEEAGNKLKGIISRLSRPQLTKTLYVETIDDLPQIGMKYLNYYVVGVTKEFFENYIKATIELSENFNRISEYIGLASERRFYEVSEQQSLLRMINIPIILEVGNLVFGEVPQIVSSSRSALIEMFTGAFGFKKPTVARVITRNEYVDGVSSEIQSTLRPLNVFGLGNSMVFNFNYKDNYSAGFKSEEYDTNKALQEYVPYTNQYGNFKMMDIDIYEDLGEMDTLDKQKELGSAFPLTTANQMLTPGNRYLKLDKVWIDNDGREQLDVTVQVHFVSNNSNVIIGNGLAKYNRLVFDTQREFNIVLLDREINLIDKYIDIENQYIIEGNIGASETLTVISGINYYSVVIHQNQIAEIDGHPTFKAWAIIDKETSELVVGKNEEIIADGTTSTSSIYINI